MCQSHCMLLKMQKKLQQDAKFVKVLGIYQGITRRKFIVVTYK